MAFRRVELSGASEEPLPADGLSKALGGVLAGAVLFFWPWGLDQFRLPKLVFLLAAVSVLLAWQVVAGGLVRATAGANRVLGILAAAAVLWICVVPVASTDNLALHLAGVLEVITLAAAALLAAAARGRGQERAAQNVLAGIGMGGLVVALFAILQGVGLDPVRLVLGLQPRGPGRWRVLTSIGNPGWTAETVAVAAPAAMAVAARAGSRVGIRWLVPGVVVPLAAGVAMTGSRAGAVALAVGVATWVLARKRGGGFPWRGVAGAVSTLVLVLVLSGVVGLWRWGELRPLTGRLGLWTAGAVLAAERPVAGWGLWQTQRVLPGGLERVAAGTPPRWRKLLPRLVVDRLDEDWLQIAVEGGVPGSFLLLGAWWVGLGVSWRRGRGEGGAADAVVAASLAVVGVLTLVSGPLHTPSTAVMFWVLLGLAAAGPSGGPVMRAAPRRPVVVHAVWLLPVAALALSAVLLRADLAAHRGRRLLGTGEAAEAAQVLRSAVDRLPWSAPAWTALARARLSAGRPGLALATVYRARRWTSSERLWAVEIEALRALDRPDLARQRLGKALRILPFSPVLRRLEDRSRAVRPGE